MSVKSMEEKLFVPGSELQKWFSVSAAKLDKMRLLQLPSPESMVEHCLAIANADGKGGSPEVVAAESIKNLVKKPIFFFLNFNLKHNLILQSNPPNGSPDNGSNRFRFWPVPSQYFLSKICQCSIRFLVQFLVCPDVEPCGFDCNIC